MRRRRLRTARREEASIDVTAFLSLMVMLVPFLLVTAVFSRVTILEVQPEAAAPEPQAMPDPLQLQVTVRRQVIEVVYRGQAQPERIEWAGEAEALQALAALVDRLKARHPQSLEAHVLLEPQIPYERLVQVLDVVRVKWQRHGEELEAQERFPLIALGAVPAAAQRTGAVP